MTTIWNVKEVATRLRDGKMTEKEGVWYLIAIGVFQTLMISTLLSSDDPFLGIAALETGVLIALTVWGIRRCHQINLRGDGKDFFLRYACLALPITLRVTILAIVVVVAVSPIAGGVVLTDQQERILFFFFEMFLTWLFYFRLGAWFFFASSSTLKTVTQTTE